ncbi:MAG: hypothetical protein AABX73_03160 [Nanoarchaeota archaeon]
MDRQRNYNLTFTFRDFAEVVESAVARAKKRCGRAELEIKADVSKCPIGFAVKYRLLSMENRSKGVLGETGFVCRSTEREIPSEYKSQCLMSMKEELVQLGLSVSSEKDYLKIH